jgi:hypothetical protein
MLHFPETIEDAIARKRLALDEFLRSKSKSAPAKQF